MPRRKTLQSNCSAGELAPDVWMRQDTAQYQNGAKSLRNRRCLIGGGSSRRPGSWRLYDLPGQSRVDSWIINASTSYVVVFSDGRFDAYLRNTVTGKLTASGSITSCPWTGDIWREMNFVQSADTMFLTHPDMRTRVITRTGAATWVLSNYAFDSGPASRVEQPYLKFAPTSMTLTPSDVTGSITLTVSGAVAWFVAAHVGAYIRYHKKACLITAVAADGLSCTATVVEQLPETYSIELSSTEGYAVGEIVEGDVTGAKGVITSIPDATHVVAVLTVGLSGFTASDKLIGPNMARNVVGTSVTTNAGVTDWDEQMFSAVYGYPSCVELHRNRLLFAGHATAPDMLIGSALNNLYNFNVGDGSDGDGFAIPIGDDAASRIVQLHSAEQLLVSTDRGPYYVPESANSPFTPSSIAFFPFGSPWPVTPSVRHVSFDNGVILLSGSTVIKASPTGNNSQQWDADEESILAHHLVDNPTDLAVTSNYAGGPERYAVFRNDDGTLAVMQRVEKQDIRNFSPWDTNGTYESVAAIEQHLYAAVTRQIAGNTLYLLELFDQDITLDCATEYETLDEAAIEADYGNMALNVVVGDRHFGTYPVTLSVAGPFLLGLYYDSQFETLPPVIDGQEGDMAGDLMRIVECYVHVKGSQRFSANGTTLSAYQTTDPVDQPPPDKNGPQKFGFMGWLREPTITINQPDPLPLDILAVRSVVAY